VSHAAGPASAPPASEAALLQRAHHLAGRTLGELGAALDIAIPNEPRRAKGLAGRLVERWLGADAGSHDGPDFTALGIELKTIPIGSDGRPRESTFVSSIDLRAVTETEWEGSRVRRKLARVLWVPVEAEPNVPLADRRVGTAWLWSPSQDQEAALRADWELLVGRLAAGEGELLTAREGTHLQVRPKAANASVDRRASDAEGAPIRTAPRGFYLRAAFTQTLLDGRS
jgi:DNA mismatch repair protein MutH